MELCIFDAGEDGVDFFICSTRFTTPGFEFENEAYRMKRCRMTREKVKRVSFF